MNKVDFVHENYSGVLGGELHYQAPNWTINFSSGRYGLHFIKEPVDRTLAISTAKLLFKKYGGVDVQEVL